MNLQNINEAVETFLWRIGLRAPMPFYWVFIPLGAGFILLVIALILLTFYRTPYAGEQWSVCNVEVSPTFPNQAYIRLYQYGCYNYGAESVIYETVNFGATWRPSWYDFNRESWAPSTTPLNGLEMIGEELFYNGQRIWGLSRPYFRTFFTPSKLYSSSSYFVPSNQNAVSGDQIYVALGQYGVLVGSNPAVAPHANDWHISSEGIQELRPKPLTITHPFLILVIVALALMVPPLPWLHGWLLGQVWRYALPDDDLDTALHLGFVTAVEISVVAVFAIIFWLANLEIDFYEVVGLMTLITVGIGVSQSFHLAQRFELNAAQTKRLAIATALVSLIVPAGVAATPLFSLGWPVIITLISGFMIYRRILTNYRNYMFFDMSRWQIDRVAMEMVALAAVAVVTFTLFFASLGPALGMWGVFGVPLLSLATIGAYTTGRGESFSTGRKSDEGTLQLLFNSSEWRYSLLWNSAYWVLSALFLSGVVFGVQAAVYTWFVSLGQY